MKVVSTVHKLLFFKTTPCITWIKDFKNILSSYESKKRNSLNIQTTKISA